MPYEIIQPNRKPIETIEEENKIKAKTPHGLILGLNQRFQREAKEDPSKTYTVNELALIFSMKVQELNYFVKKGDIELEEWDQKLPVLNKEKVEENKTLLLDNFDKGVKCPCCKQYVRRYKRKINSSMARCLIIIYKYFNKPSHDEWLHVESYMKTIPDIPAALRGDFPKLRYWNLIESKKETQEDGNPNSGYYRITNKGREFVEFRIKVKKEAFIYNDELLGFSDEETTIKDSLKDKFNYEELMSQ